MTAPTKRKKHHSLHQPFKNNNNSKRIKQPWSENTTNINSQGNSKLNK
jgi:hypothetical protein